MKTELASRGLQNRVMIPNFIPISNKEINEVKRLLFVSYSIFDPSRWWFQPPIGRNYARIKWVHLIFPMRFFVFFLGGGRSNKNKHVQNHHSSKGPLLVVNPTNHPSWIRGKKLWCKSSCKSWGASFL